IHGAIPSKSILTTDDIVVIEDIAPKAPVHYLIIPKKHIPDVASLTSSDMPLVGSSFLIAQDLGKNLGKDSSFRLVINNGSQAGQSVFHLHLHFLAGKDIPSMTSHSL